MESEQSSSTILSRVTTLPGKCMKNCLYSAIFLLLSCVCHAQSAEYVVTRNGSRYEGYVSEQVPGKSIAVMADWAEIHIPTDSLMDVTKSYDASTGKTIGSFTACGVKYENVVILVQGLRNTVVSVNETKEFIIPWDTLQKKGKLDSDLTSTGIKEIVTTVDGRVLKGVITEQILDQGIVRVSCEDDDVQVLNDNEIQSVAYEPTSMEADLWEQTRFLDEIHMKDGSSLSGFISQRSSTGIINFITLENGKTVSIRMANVASYSKIVNKDYNRPAGEVSKRKSTGNTVAPKRTKTGKSDKETSTELPEYDGPTLVINGVVKEWQEIAVTKGGTMIVSCADVPDVSIEDRVEVECWNTEGSEELYLFNTGKNTIETTDKPERHIYLKQESDNCWIGDVLYDKSGICLITTPDFKYGITINID